MSYKDKVLTKERNRATERKQNRSGFTSRNYWLSVGLVFIVLPIGTCLSAFTEGFNYYHTWAAALSPFARWGAVIALASVTNILVIMLGKGVVDDIQDGVFSGKGYDKIAFVIKSIAFAAVFAFSVTQSLEGAPLFREYIQETNEPIANLLTDPATINAEYAERRAQQLSIIESAKRTTWKGNMTRDAVRSMRTAQAAVNKIDEQIAAGRLAVQASNDNIIEEWNADLTRNSEKAYGIAGIGQLVMISGIIFLGLWNTGVEDELGTDAGADAGAMGAAGTSSPRGIGFHPAAAAHHPTGSVAHPDPTTTTDHRPIGFKHYERNPTPPGTGGPSSPSSLPEADAATDGTVPTGAPEAGGAHSVETRLDGAATGNPEAPEAQSRLAAWRSHNGNLASYTNRRPTKSNIKSIARLEELKAHEEKQLALMGWRIELQESPRKAYILVPV